MTEADLRKPPKKKTAAAVVGGVLVAVLPALLTYLENRDQIKTKTQKNQEDAIAGYAALADSVKELQARVVTQHEFMIRLEANLAAMDKYVLDSLNRALSRPIRVGGTYGPIGPATDKPPETVKPPSDPKFKELPADLPRAAVQYAPKH